MARGKYIRLERQFDTRCPWCGEERKIYVLATVRGPKTRRGGHRPGEHRVKRELRATCGKKRCITLQRGATLSARHGGDR